MNKMKGGLRVLMLTSGLHMRVHTHVPHLCHMHVNHIQRQIKKVAEGSGEEVGGQHLCSTYLKADGEKEERLPGSALRCRRQEPAPG